MSGVTGKCDGLLYSVSAFAGRWIVWEYKLLRGNCLPDAAILGGAGRRGGGILYLAVVVLIMLDHWRQMHGAYGPYEVSMWIMELLIFALIAYEVWNTVSEKRKARKRASQIKERSDQMFVCMTKGQELLKAAPPRHPSEAVTLKHSEEWGKSVSAWILETANLLGNFSSPAMAVFLDDSAISSAAYPEVPHYAQRLYSTLNHKLANLRSIVEKLDRYL